ncbi:MAG: hypothetical protein AB7V77_03530 [Candidatus Woesearchaeota archaeon]
MVEKTTIENFIEGLDELLPKKTNYMVNETYKIFLKGSSEFPRVSIRVRENSLGLEATFQRFYFKDNKIIIQGDLPYDTLSYAEKFAKENNLNLEYTDSLDILK